MSAAIPKRINLADYLSMPEAAQLMRRGGSGPPPNYRTMLRWADPRRGRSVGGRVVVLHAVTLGDERLTTREWVEEFLAACLRDEPPAEVAPARAEAEERRARRRLAEKGVI